MAGVPQHPVWTPYGTAISGMSWLADDPQGPIRPTAGTIPIAVSIPMSESGRSLASDGNRSTRPAMGRCMAGGSNGVVVIEGHRRIFQQRHHLVGE